MIFPKHIVPIKDSLGLSYEGLSAAMAQLSKVHVGPRLLQYWATGHCEPRYSRWEAVRYSLVDLLKDAKKFRSVMREIQPERLVVADS